MDYRVISADCHIDLIWLPADLFTSNASAAMKERMPFVTDGDDGPIWISNGGAQFGLQNGMGSAGRKYVPGEIQRADRMAQTGLVASDEEAMLVAMVDQLSQGLAPMVSFWQLGQEPQIVTSIG